jgi:hypothetical protein
MKKFILILFGIAFSIPAHSMTYYECKGYLQKGVGNDLVFPFQTFLEEDYLDISLGSFFGEKATIVFHKDLTNGPDTYVLTMHSPTGAFDNPTRVFTFKKWQPFRFTDFWFDHGKVEVSCKPKEWPEQSP